MEFLNLTMSFQQSYRTIVLNYYNLFRILKGQGAKDFLKTVMK
jgi:hypothetical protein